MEEEQLGIKGKLELSKLGSASVEASANELASAAGAARREYRARFVRAGRIRSAGGRPGNIEIEPSALATNAGKFNNRAVFVDHAGWFDYPSLRNLVGVTDLAAWNEETQSIDGVLRLYDLPGC